MAEDEPPLDPVIEEAYEKLKEAGFEQMFAAPLLTNYYLQPLADGTCAIILGSAGTVPSRDGERRPVAHLSSVCRVNEAFLRNLAKTINGLYPPEGPSDVG